MQSPQKQPAERITAKHRVWWFGLFLIAATFLVYWPALQGGFIWDDDAHISDNLTLRSAQGLWDIWFKPGATCQYYPLSFTVFWAGYHFWGLNTLGYHLQNLALHGLVAVLLWQVLKRLEVRAAWLAGAIFALHPVNVMSVAWMTELKNTLSGALVLGAAWAYLRFAGLGIYETRTQPGRDWRWGVLSLALFQLAMFAKTAVSFLPLTLLLLVWWKRGRIAWRQMWPVLVMLGLTVAMGLVTLHIEKVRGASGDEFQMSLIERVLVSGRSFWFYLGKLFFPYSLTFIYERWEIDPGAWWQYVYPAATLGLLGGLWGLRNRLGRGPFSALLHFYIATSFLVLVQVLYMMRYTFVSDHWQYFGAMSVVAVTAAGMDRAFDFAGRGRRFLERGFCGALLLTLGWLTWRQCGMYRDVDTLWQVTLARNPDCWMAHNNWGIALAQQGKPDEGIHQLQEAIRIKPDYADAFNNLGGVLAKQQKVAEAIQCYAQALALKPDFAEAHCNLGVALAAQGKVTEAVQHFEEAVQLKPDYAEAHCYLGIAIAGQGRPAEAGAEFQQALDLATAQGNSRLAESIRARWQAAAVPAPVQNQTP